MEKRHQHLERDLATKCTNILGLMESEDDIFVCVTEKEG